MSGSEIDEMLEKARREKSYFDDLEDLKNNAEERWARIEKDGTMAKILDVDPSRSYNSLSG